MPNTSYICSKHPFPNIYYIGSQPLTVSSTHGDVKLSVQDSNNPKNNDVFHLIWYNTLAGNGTLHCSLGRLCHRWCVESTTYLHRKNTQSMRCRRPRMAASASSQCPKEHSDVSCGLHMYHLSTARHFSYTVCRAKRNVLTPYRGMHCAVTSLRRLGVRWGGVLGTRVFVPQLCT